MGQWAPPSPSCSLPGATIVCINVEREREEVLLYRTTSYKGGLQEYQKVGTRRHVSHNPTPPNLMKE